MIRDLSPLYLGAMVDESGKIGRKAFAFLSHSSYYAQNIPS
jgi:hypothetical protein